jgi:hypothetical protein
MGGFAALACLRAGGVIGGEWPTVCALGLVVLAVVGAAITVVLRRSSRPRVLAARLAAISALALTAGQAAWQVRPLDLYCDAAHQVVGQAVEFTRQAPYAGRTVLTQHVMVHMLRDNTKGVFGNQSAIQAWRDAPPGTLFLWESTYCDKKHEPEPSLELQAELRRLGRSLWKTQVQDVRGEVFERSPGPRRATTPATARAFTSLLPDG